ncbi:AcrR family transcriptional regulator [Microbacterium trichothecenolyticum]|uniref:TetR/AcrR family transcriptional regulator n=1 Tax=Microbacterium trichothecenolyticum TaxID=69370 RepID=UPI00286306E1|nr:TetR/AcrR family transcriptional regulator [Microbacterium trichothecenolyticum]MDR7185010.1 AcrR family transcriptional regulator [Microbacterium trichothecenolyticum]
MRQPSYAKGMARRDEMLAAAMHAIAGAGFRRLSLREIARESGVEAAHLVYYFGSRDGLLQAVIERWDADTQAARAVDAVPDRPLDFLVEHVRLNLYVPGFVHLLHSFAAEAVAPDHEAHAFFRERYERVAQQIAEGITAEQDAGFIPPDLDPADEAQRLIAVSDGVQLQALLDERIDAVALLAGAVEALRSLADDPAVRLSDESVPQLASLRKGIAASA